MENEEIIDAMTRESVDVESPVVTTHEYMNITIGYTSEKKVVLKHAELIGVDNETRLFMIEYDGIKYMFNMDKILYISTEDCEEE